MERREQQHDERGRKECPRDFHLLVCGLRIACLLASLVLTEGGERVGGEVKVGKGWGERRGRIF